MTQSECKAYAQAIFAQHPELFSDDRRQAILNGVIVLGMTPFEARLAGGAFAYKVVADKSKWPENADPLQVMWGQSKLVDDSKIWRFFRNSSQFSDVLDSAFRVYFERGRAVKIEKLGAADVGVN